MKTYQESYYETDLTSAEWERIKHYLPESIAFGRPRNTSLREVVNAIFYLNKTGCAWRYLPHDFPPWQTVYRYYRQFVELGIWERIAIEAAKSTRKKQRTIDDHRRPSHTSSPR